jgi:hypothetical protein
MTQIISRIYDSRERAAEAVKALKDYGFSGLDIHAVLARSSSQGGVTAAPAEIDDLVTSIQKAGIFKSRAEIYADRVRSGGNLVTVHAPFGSAHAATQILDRFDPIDSGVAEEAGASLDWVDAAPLSSALQIPLLLDDPAAFSSAIGLPVLLDYEPRKTSLLSSPSPLSSTIGLPTLSDDATPLSSRIGLSVLSDKAAPLSSSVGLALLSDNPAPFSALFKLPLLTKG